MKIGSREVREIQITYCDDIFIASITDENVVYMENVKISFVDSVYAGPEDSSGLSIQGASKTNLAGE